MHRLCRGADNKFLSAALSLVESRPLTIIAWWAFLRAGTFQKVMMIGECVWPTCSWCSLCSAVICCGERVLSCCCVILAEKVHAADWGGVNGRWDLVFKERGRVSINGGDGRLVVLFRELGSNHLFMSDFPSVGDFLSQNRVSSRSDFFLRNILV